MTPAVGIESEEEVQEIRNQPPEEDRTMDPAPAPKIGSRPPKPPSPDSEMGWVSWMEGEGPEPTKTGRAIPEEQRASRQQLSPESLSEFGDSEVEVLNEIDLEPLGRELFLGQLPDPTYRWWVGSPAISA